MINFSRGSIGIVIPLGVILLGQLNHPAAVYDVGPSAGQITSLANVPWGNLAPGDAVNIHCKPGGYHEIFQLSESGSAQNPILVHGVPDPITGALPILDGQQAVTAPNCDFRNTVFENLGVILVTPRKAKYLYGVNPPAWITIENLDIRNALYTADGSISFTDQHGVTRPYNSFGCGIYVEMARHLTIRGCEISFCGNGIFANSKNGGAESSSDLLIEKNYLHDNGQPLLPDPNNPGQLLSNGYHEHHIYVESDQAVYQFNRFGPLRTNCFGCMIKDRSAGTVIRYNEITATDTSDIFAILDPQGGAGYIDQKPNYPDAFVYGNILTWKGTSTGHQGDIVWFAAANGPKSYPTQHRGTLYFYQNTIVNHHGGIAAFSLTDTYMAGTTNIFEKVDCRNNI